MAKAHAPKKTLDQFPEIERIRNRLNGGEPNDIVILFVPSKDRFHKEVANRKAWQDEAIKLVGTTFGGCTAFPGLIGIWYESKKKKLHEDNPTMIESLTTRASLDDEKKMTAFLNFCEHMGRSMNQAAVGIIVNDRFVELTIDYGNEMFEEN